MEQKLETLRSLERQRRLFQETEPAALAAQEAATAADKAESLAVEALARKDAAASAVEGLAAVAKRQQGEMKKKLEKAEQVLTAARNASDLEKIKAERVVLDATETMKAGFTQVAQPTSEILGLDSEAQAASKATMLATASNFATMLEETANRQAASASVVAAANRDLEELMTKASEMQQELQAAEAQAQAELEQAQSEVLRTVAIANEKREESTAAQFLAVEEAKRLNAEAEQCAIDEAAAAAAAEEARVLAEKKAEAQTAALAYRLEQECKLATAMAAASCSRILEQANADAEVIQVAQAEARLTALHSQFPTLHAQAMAASLSKQLEEMQAHIAAVTEELADVEARNQRVAAAERAVKRAEAAATAANERAQEQQELAHRASEETASMNKEAAASAKAARLAAEKAEQCKAATIQQLENSLAAAKQETSAAVQAAVATDAEALAIVQKLKDLELAHSAELAAAATEARERVAAAESARESYFEFARAAAAKCEQAATQATEETAVLEARIVGLEGRVAELVEAVAHEQEQARRALASAEQQAKEAAATAQQQRELDAAQASLHLAEQLAVMERRTEGRLQIEVQTAEANARKHMGVAGGLKAELASARQALTAAREEAKIYRGRIAGNLERVRRECREQLELQRNKAEILAATKAEYEERLKAAHLQAVAEADAAEIISRARLEVSQVNATRRLSQFVTAMESSDQGGALEHAAAAPTCSTMDVSVQAELTAVPAVSTTNMAAQVAAVAAVTQTLVPTVPAQTQTSPDATPPLQPTTPRSTPCSPVLQPRVLEAAGASEEHIAFSRRLERQVSDLQKQLKCMRAAVQSARHQAQQHSEALALARAHSEQNGSSWPDVEEPHNRAVRVLDEALGLRSREPTESPTTSIESHLASTLQFATQMDPSVESLPVPFQAVAAMPLLRAKSLVAADLRFDENFLAPIRGGGSIRTTTALAGSMQHAGAGVAGAASETFFRPIASTLPASNGGQTAPRDDGPATNESAKKTPVGNSHECRERVPQSRTPTDTVLLDVVTVHDDADSDDCVAFVMRLDMDYRTVTSSVQAADDFRKALVLDVLAALSAAGSRLEIDELLPGSVMVHARLFAPKGSPAGRSSELLATLVAQLDDEGSVLKGGSVTRHAMAIKVADCAPRLRGVSLAVNSADSVELFTAFSGAHISPSPSHRALPHLLSDDNLTVDRGVTTILPRKRIVLPTIAPSAPSTDGLFVKRPEVSLPGSIASGETDANPDGPAPSLFSSEDLPDIDESIFVPRIWIHRFTSRSLIRRLVIQIVKNKWFENFILTAIIASCCFMAAYDPLDTVEANPDSSRRQVLEVASQVSSVIFALEFILKVIALGAFTDRHSYFRDRWNLLDFAIVVIGCLDFVPEGPDLRSLKVLRLMRPLRALRMITHLEELRFLVTLLLKCLPMLLHVVALCTFIFCVFGIVAVQLWKGILRQRCYGIEDGELYSSDYVCSMPSDDGMQKCPAGFRCLRAHENPNGGGSHFDNVAGAMLTLFQVMTMEAWTDIMHRVQDAYSFWVCVYFVLLVIVGPMFAIQLFLAVIATKFSEAKETLRALTALGARSPMQSGRTWRMIKRSLSNAHHRVVNKLRARSGKVVDHKSASAFSGNENFATARKMFNQVYDVLFGWCGVLARSEVFTVFVAILIMLNMLLLSLDHAGQSDDFAKTLETINMVFTLLFLAEMIVKLLGLGLVGYIMDTFNIFDAILVAISVTELVASFVGSELLGVAGVNVLRTFRLLRVTRIVKLLRVAPGLVRQLAILGSTLQSVGMLVILIVIFSIMFAILGMNLFGGNMNLEDGLPPRSNFDSFVNSFVTVFQCLTLEDWQLVMFNAMQTQGPASCLYFIALIVLGNFMLFNLFVAIIIQGFAENKASSNPDDDDSSVEDDVGKAASKDKKMSFWHKVQHCESPNALGLFAPDHPVRIRATRVVKATSFQNVVLFVIIISSLAVGADRPSAIDPEAAILNYVSIACNMFFLLELILKLVSLGFFGCPNAYIHDPWHRLDFVIVIASVLDTWFLYSNRRGELQSFFRVLRIFRAFRPLRVVSRARGLKAVFTALVFSIRPILTTLVIASVCFVIFAILGLQLFMGKLHFCSDPSVFRMEDCTGSFMPEDGRELQPREWLNGSINFDNIGNALLACFVLASQDNWPTIMYSAVDSTGPTTGPIRNYAPVNGLYFVVFVIIGSMLIINIFIGVFVESYKTSSTILSMTNVWDQQNKKLKTAASSHSLETGSDTGTPVAYGALFSPTPSPRINEAWDSDGPVPGCSPTPHLGSRSVWDTRNLDPETPGNTTDDQAPKDGQAPTTPQPVSPHAQGSAGGVLLPPRPILRSVSAQSLFSSTPSLASDTPNSRSNSAWRTNNRLTVTLNSNSDDDDDLNSGVGSRASRSPGPSPCRTSPGPSPGRMTTTNGNVILMRTGSFSGQALLRAKSSHLLLSPNNHPSNNTVSRPPPPLPAPSQPENSDKTAEFLSARPLQPISFAPAHGDYVSPLPSPGASPGLSPGASPLPSPGPAPAVPPQIDIPKKRANLDIARLESFIASGTPESTMSAMWEDGEFGTMTMDELARYLPTFPPTFQGAVMEVTSEKWFDLLVAALICLNIVSMMFEAWPEEFWQQDFLLITNYFFTMCFAFELLVKLYAWTPHVYLLDPWNRFDIAVTLASLFGLVIDEAGASLGGLNPTILRVFRVFRILRILRAFRIFKFAQGLQEIVGAMVSSLPAIGNLGAVLFLLFYVYAVLGVELWGELCLTDSTAGACARIANIARLDMHAHFGTTGHALLVLFRVSTADNWAAVMTACATADPECVGGTCGRPVLSPFYFISFVCLSSFIMLNLVVAIMMHNLAKDNEVLAVNLTKSKFERIVNRWRLKSHQRTELIVQGINVDSEAEAWTREFRTKKHSPRVREMMKSSRTAYRTWKALQQERDVRNVLRRTTVSATQASRRHASSVRFSGDDPTPPPSSRARRGSVIATAAVAKMVGGARSPLTGVAPGGSPSRSLSRQSSWAMAMQKVIEENRRQSPRNTSRRNSESVLLLRPPSSGNLQALASPGSEPVVGPLGGVVSPRATRPPAPVRAQSLAEWSSPGAASPRRPSELQRAAGQRAEGAVDRIPSALTIGDDAPAACLAGVMEEDEESMSQATSSRAASPSRTLVDPDALGRLLDVASTTLAKSVPTPIAEAPDTTLAEDMDENASSSGESESEREGGTPVRGLPEL